MSRRVLVTLAAISCLALASVPAGLAQDQTDIALRVAKTQRRVTLFGYVEPRQSGRVVVRLFRHNGERWVRLESTRVELSRAGDSDGNGTGESSFRARFPRPKTGNCRGVAKMVGERVSDVDEFPCAIPDFPRGSATLTTGPTRTIEIDALIAETNAHRAYGFMYRPHIPDDLGMAFLYPEEGDYGGFWMKNTLVPLSIAFFNDEGVILRIMDMEPCFADDDSIDCESYDPGVSYRGTLEVNQGAFEEWDVSEGDEIEVTH